MKIWKYSPDLSRKMVAIEAGQNNITTHTSTGCGYVSIRLFDPNSEDMRIDIQADEWPELRARLDRMFAREQGKS